MILPRSHAERDLRERGTRLGEKIGFVSASFTVACEFSVHAMFRPGELFTRVTAAA